MEWIHIIPRVKVIALSLVTNKQINAAQQPSRLIHYPIQDVFIVLYRCIWYQIHTWIFQTAIYVLPTSHWILSAVQTSRKTNSRIGKYQYIKSCLKNSAITANDKGQAQKCVRIGQPWGNIHKYHVKLYRKCCTMTVNASAVLWMHYSVSFNWISYFISCELHSIIRLCK